MSGVKFVVLENWIVIGLIFGNFNSFIVYIVDDKVEVIVNEDGGKYQI